jgi:hypothetical protein
MSATPNVIETPNSTGGVQPAIAEFRLVLPKPGNAAETVEISHSGSVVVVGANGSGKSRLGNWLDQQSPGRAQVHRISAQKSLSIPDATSPTAVSKAEAQLWYGHGDAVNHQQPWAYKIGHRWGNRPNSYLLNDYENLLVLLFSDEFEQSTKYRAAAKEPAGRTAPPDTKLDITKRIWEETLPHRKLLIGGGEIHTFPTGRSEDRYKASEMSDGERVIFYLIGEVVCAPPSSVIVIDEPELHLHKSIQARLWDAIEDQRPDCQFLYLTHDVDFATSRLKAVKICVQSFDGKNWEWFLAPAIGIPETILLQILGSRKPVLFVEGEATSTDQQLFSHVYPDYTVIGSGGCNQVINSTSAFSAQKSLHHLECNGIVDRDTRDENEINALKAKGIFVLDFAEIENVFLDEGVLEAIAADLLKTPEFPQTMDAFKNHVFTRLREEQVKVVSSLVSTRIKSKLQVFPTNIEGAAEIQASLAKVANEIDVGALFSEFETRVNHIIANHNYREAITLFSDKGLLARAAGLFSMKRDDFLEHILRLICSARGGPLVKRLQGVLPKLPLTTKTQRKGE